MLKTRLAVLVDLKLCSDLYLGRILHAAASENQNGSHLHVITALMKMYAKCGSMGDSQCMFDRIDKPDVVSWNVLLLGYSEQGNALATLELFERMKASGCSPSSATYIAALKACTSVALNGDHKASLEWGRQIHSQMRSNLDLHVESTLIDMYSKCGSMVDARLVFDSIQEPDVVAWNALVLGYAENGEEHVALDLFSRMQDCRPIPDSVTYIAVIKACTSLAIKGDFERKREFLEKCRYIHSKLNWHLNDSLHNVLMNMYAKCGSMVEAHRVFDTIQKPNVVSWNTLLLGYAGNGQGHVSLELLERMKGRGFVPDTLTYVAALKACTDIVLHRDGKYLTHCRDLHMELGCHLNHPYIQNTVVDMYSKCGRMTDAHAVFDDMHKPDVVSWTVLLLGYVENGEGHATLRLFFRMKALGCVPDSVTYIAAIRACGLIGALPLGRRLHSEIPDFTPRLVTVLVDFYAKCGSMLDASEVFNLHSKARGIPTWNALLTGYGSFGDSRSVFDLFYAMQDQGLKPDAGTLVCLLLCCSHAGLEQKAWEYFDAMPVHYGITPTLMHHTCMVDVLGRGNRLSEAIAMLNKMPCSPDAVAWTGLLCACCKWKNVEIGRMALQSLVTMDSKDASTHILMAHIYRASFRQWP